MSILLRGGRIFDGGGRDAKDDLLIAQGRVADTLKASQHSRDTLALKDEDIVLPGLVDLAAHFGLLGADCGEAVASEIKAAAASGVTTLCCLPDTEPVLDSLHAVNLIQSHAEAAGRCRVLTIGAATRNLDGATRSELSVLKQAGCVGVSNLLRPYADTRILLQVMLYAAHLNLLVFICPQDASLAAQGCAHDGSAATRLGLPGIPEVAETAMLSQCLALVEATGARVHFCRVSCARSVELIAQAKQNNLPVTADVAIHQLFFHEEDLLSFDTNYHVLPPYRRRADREALRAGVQDGTIDIVCSDHQPRSIEAKQAPFPDSRPGIASAQLLLPLALELVDDGVLSMQRAIETVSLAPARLLSLETGLHQGARADLCVVERAEWTPNHNSWFSQGFNHPFGNHTFRWRVKKTIVNGRVCYP